MRKFRLTIPGRIHSSKNHFKMERARNIGIAFIVICITMIPVMTDVSVVYATLCQTNN